MDFVSWDAELPNMESHKIPWFQSAPSRYDYIYTYIYILDDYMDELLLSTLIYGG